MDVRESPSLLPLVVGVFLIRLESCAHKRIHGGIHGTTTTTTTHPCHLGTFFRGWRCGGGGRGTSRVRCPTDVSWGNDALAKEWRAVDSARRGCHSWRKSHVIHHRLRVPRGHANSIGCAPSSFLPPATAFPFARHRQWEVLFFHLSLSGLQWGGVHHDGGYGYHLPVPSHAREQPPSDVLSSVDVPGTATSGVGGARRHTQRPKGQGQSCQVAFGSDDVDGGSIGGNVHTTPFTSSSFLYPARVGTSAEA